MNYSPPGSSVHGLFQVRTLATQKIASVGFDSLSMDCSLPGSSVHGISQARILEWVSHSLLQGIFPTQALNRISCIAGRFFTTEPPVHAKLLQSCPTLQDHVACSPPGSSARVFSKQEYWSRLPFPTPGDLPNPGIKTASLMSPALAGRFFTTRATWEARRNINTI